MRDQDPSYQTVVSTLILGSLRALVNEDTLLRTHCCPWAAQTGKHLLRTKNVSEQNQKQFLPVPDTKFVSGTQEMSLILSRNILCPRQMLPSLRSPRNIMGNNVSATMCPRLSGPLTLLFCRGWQRNVQRFITHVHSYCSAH